MIWTQSNPQECKVEKPILTAICDIMWPLPILELQTRAERWIHDLALRNTMLRAHRQAWAWQDEWVGLNMSDIRRLEAEAAEHLSAVMAAEYVYYKAGQVEGWFSSSLLLPLQERRDCRRLRRVF